MNFELLRFSRYVTRFLLGLTIAVLLSAAFLGKSEAQNYLALIVFEPPKGKMPVNMAFLFFCIAVASALGSLLSEVAIQFFGAVTIMLHRILSRHTRGRQGLSFLAVMFKPLPSLTLSLIKTYQERTLTFLKYSSLSDAAFFSGERARLDKYYREIGDYLNSLHDSDIEAGFAYAQSITQEQRAVDNRRIEVANIYCLWLVIGAGAILALAWGSFNFLLGGCMVAIWAATLPYLYHSRFTLILALAYNFLDSVRVAESADVADRDAV